MLHHDPEGIALIKLARLHEHAGERDQAAHYHRQTLERALRYVLGGYREREISAWRAQTYMFFGPRFFVHCKHNSATKKICHEVPNILHLIDTKN